MAQKVLPIPMPLGGVNKVVARERQPEDTCWDALNVLPFDSYGRARVGQRFGITKAWNLALGSTFVQGLLPVLVITYPTNNSTDGYGQLPPIAVIPIPSTKLAGIVSTWTSGGIPWSTGTGTGGRLSDGTAANATRPNSGPGGPIVPGTGGGTGGGGANNTWTVTAGPSTAGTVNEAYAMLTYGGSTDSIKVKWDGTGTGFISPGSSTLLIITTSSGTGTTLLAEHGQPGFYGSSTQCQVQYTVSLSPSSTGTTVTVTMHQTSGNNSTLLGTSTSTIGTAAIFPSPYTVAATVFLNSTGSAAPYVVTLL